MPTENTDNKSYSSETGIDGMPYHKKCYDRYEKELLLASISSTGMVFVNRSLVVEKQAINNVGKSSRVNKLDVETCFYLYMRVPVRC